MEERNGKFRDDPDSHQMTQIFTEFLARVARLEQLSNTGAELLSRLHNRLDQVQRAHAAKSNNSLSEPTEAVKAVIKANETKSLTSYIEAGWVTVHDEVNRLCSINSSYDGLQDHKVKAGEIIRELKCLMEDAKRFLLNEPSHVEDKGDEAGIDSRDLAPLMAEIFWMVKQENVMQERIFGRLSMSMSVEELETYCQMWSLRPHVDDAVISKALKLIP